MTATAQTLTLADLQNFEGVLYVENLSMHHVTCNDLVTKRAFALGPKGSDNSIRTLPKEVAAQPGFQRLWMKGDVVISTDPSMQERIALAAQEQTLRQQARLDDLQAVVEAPSATRSLVERKCLISGERVFQTEQEVKDMVPPLAERYKDRASEFVATEVLKDGQPTLVWNTVTVEGSNG